MKGTIKLDAELLAYLQAKVQSVAGSEDITVIKKSTQSEMGKSYNYVVVPAQKHPAAETLQLLEEKKALIAEALKKTFESLSSGENGVVISSDVKLKTGKIEIGMEIPNATIAAAIARNNDPEIYDKAVQALKKIAV